MEGRIMRRRLDAFFQKFENKSLEDYFELNQNDGSLKVCVDRIHENEMILTIQKQKECPVYDFDVLPLELSRMISVYNAQIIHMQLKIVFSPDYPFSQPIWSLMNVEQTFLSPPINLQDYYSYLVDNHNSQYSIFWTPAIDVEKDILDFIRKINYFEYLYQPQY